MTVTRTNKPYPGWFREPRDSPHGWYAWCVSVGAWAGLLVAVLGR